MLTTFSEVLENSKRRFIEKIWSHENNESLRSKVVEEIVIAENQDFIFHLTE